LICPLINEKIYGTGPIKIVFSKALSNSPTALNAFFKRSYDIINKGVKVTEPFKTLFANFSFYFDLTRALPI